MIADAMLGVAQGIRKRTRARRTPTKRWLSSRAIPSPTRKAMPIDADGPDQVRPIAPKKAGVATIAW